MGADAVVGRALVGRWRRGGRYSGPRRSGSAQEAAGSVAAQPAEGTPAAPLLTVRGAWRLLCRRTGGQVSASTFYRWINDGRIDAIRVGFRFMVPLSEIERVVRLCLAGERL